jgi:cob(I)alamin adenosyltransferase
MARIYTRTGDGGETSLIGGARARKADVRVDLYGEADELNCVLGLASALLARHDDAAADRLRGELAAVQAALFALGAVLADPERSEALAREDAGVPGLDTAALERRIDALAADLPPLATFILPGGCAAGAALHAARGVCRRLERRAVAAAAEIAVPPAALPWLNRLSDWLFTAARWLNAEAGVPEIPWTPAGDQD